MTDNIRFEWDLRKAEANCRKHGIDFEFAKQVFYDPLRKTAIEGDEHGETRWRTIGEIDGAFIALVCHTTREEREIEVIRIISARKATRRERREYEEAP